MSTPSTTLESSPLAAALERLGAKSPVASLLRTREWEQVPAGLRDQAFFSAGVATAEVLQAMRDRLKAAAALEAPGGTPMDRSRFVAELRALLGAQAGDSRRLTDLTSFKRLELIWDFQMADAHGKARWKAGLGAGALDLYPAQELVRVESRQKPREWWERWAAAGAVVNWEGASRRRMVALKTSPIWAKLSRFGRPWPPFDFGSGMGLVDVEREEAEALGLLGPDDVLDGEAAEREANDVLEASVKGLDPDLRQALEEAFGGQVDVRGDRVRWVGRPTAEEAAPRLTAAEREAVKDYSYNNVGHSLNAELRTGSPSPEALSRTKEINQALDKISPYAGTVYRRTEWFADVDKMHPGYVHHERGFASSSRLERQQGFDGKVFFVIQARTVRDVSALSRSPAQEELLFKSGTRFLVTSRNSRGEDLVIEMEELAWP